MRRTCGLLFLARGFYENERRSMTEDRQYHYGFPFTREDPVRTLSCFTGYRSLSAIRAVLTLTSGPSKPYIFVFDFTCHHHHKKLKTTTENLVLVHYKVTAELYISKLWKFP